MRIIEYRRSLKLHHPTHQAIVMVSLVLIMLGVALPAMNLLLMHSKYDLNAQTAALVGTVNQNLAKQLKYDPQSDAYVFNQKDLQTATETVGPEKVPMSLLQAKVGGGSGSKTDTNLYSVSLPTDPTKGITFADSNTKQAFTLTPDFTQMQAEVVQGHIVYPTKDNAQMVYSVKNNGLKEDIVLKSYQGDDLIFRYSLNLPKTLEARLLDDGSLGIYSADASLYGDVQTTDDQDIAKLQQARITSAKTNLVFVIPAPVIKQTNQQGQGTATARFGLSQDHHTLTVEATGLKTLSYPISIDPSLVVTNTSDFQQGNSEDNIDYSTAGEVDRGGLTGGSTGSWSDTGKYLGNTYRSSGAVVVYNQYIYNIGGSVSFNQTTSSDTTTIYRATIGTAGTLTSSWASLTNSPLPVAISLCSAVAYNGFMYVVGGNFKNTIYRAAIASNGDLNNWTLLANVSGLGSGSASAISKGYLYSISGSNEFYVQVNADGNLGTITTTTGVSGASSGSGVFYNGYAYYVGGNYSGIAQPKVYYAPLLGSSGFGTWTLTTALPIGMYTGSVVATGGYLYSIGGCTSATYCSTTTSVVYYAPVYASGAVGQWSSSSSLPVARYQHTSVAYQGYVFTIGGATAANYSNSDVLTTKIDPAGITTGFSDTSQSLRDSSVANGTRIAYNGYLYYVGGGTKIEYAKINVDGTLGSWTYNAYDLPASRSGASVVAYNNTLYVMGGSNGTNNTNTVYYAKIGSSGSTTENFHNDATYNMLQSISSAGAVAYRGYMYLVDGNLSGGGGTNQVNSMPIGANGPTGAWSSLGTGPNSGWGNSLMVYNGYLYSCGGGDSSNNYVVDRAHIKTDGTGGLDAWGSVTTTAPASGTFTTAFLANGNLYFGGNRSSAAVYFAPLKSDGTLGSWSVSAAAPDTGFYINLAQYYGYIYAIGESGRSTYSARINNGGNGTIGSWTLSSKHLNEGLSQEGAVANRGKLYVIAGVDTGTGRKLVYHTTINSDGSVSANWVSDTSLPLALAPSMGNQVAIYNNIAYVVGMKADLSSSLAYYGAIDTSGGANDGKITSWTPTNQLKNSSPYMGSGGNLLAYNGYLYYLNGVDSSGAPSSIVYYSQIQADGSLGTWQTTTSTSVAAQNASATIVNGTIYSIGGCTATCDGTDATSTVSYAKIDPSTHQVGAWSNTGGLPIKSSKAAIASFGGYIYVMGGQDGTSGGQNDSMYIGAVDADGEVESWQNIGQVAQGSSHWIYGALTISNGNILAVGGEDAGGNSADTIYSAQMNTIPRIGHYSYLFNFGSLQAPVSVTYNTTRQFTGSSSAEYATAANDGLLSAFAPISSFTGASNSCAATGTTQYLQVYFTLDDTQNASFPDSSSAATGVTDITVSYAGGHPPPNLRLHGGKFFLGQTLQPLDTCGP